MNNLERTKAAGQALSTLDSAADVMVNRVLGHVWFLSDPEIDQVASTAGRLERAAYIVRGACGYAMRHRLKARGLNRDSADLKGELAKVAARWGVDYTTLCKDIQMYETFHLPEKLVEPDRPALNRFFESAPASSAPAEAAEPAELVPTVVLEHVPPRYIEEECLRAPDPRAALEMAEAKRGVGNYSREQVRADVDALRANAAVERSGLFAGQGREPDTTDTLLEIYWQKFPIRAKEREALYAASRQADCSPGDLIVQWIAQGCIVLPADALESLEAQMCVYGKRGGRYSGGDYVAKLLKLREANLVKSGQMTATRLTAGEGDEE